ncbi:D-beta-hydroxybutyrate dehydrogenase, mitochondrial-like isoform X2 [Lethenteron reissneri]|uniref:D-beta-hydroxybutyrate dehydrogenase, mitochondrial-like isoform X2 n=1 Tax=Lethenteron reissneri TaxID=7753 RepID=UPI002AB6BF2F|nr:D-beta-hydroxybutyrate dehydrogenase, mitochondrial-like isoform X2 [Lethenteron reissneri]
MLSLPLIFLSSLHCISPTSLSLISHLSPWLSVFPLLPEFPPWPFNINGDLDIRPPSPTHDQATPTRVVNIVQTTPVTGITEEGLHPSLHLQRNVHHDYYMDLWAVVNNAGITHLGEVEMCNMNTYQRVANVNLWGTIRTTMAFLPLVKASKGRIVNMSSISAHLHTSFNSAYCVTKSGVDAFSNCLRVEMKKWDVKVVLIEPGTFISHTNIMQNQDTKSIYRSLTESQKTQFTTEYIDTYMKASQSFRKIECKNPGLVIDAIVEALTASKPDTCYLVCSFIERVIVFLLRNLPTAWTDIIFTSTLNERKRRSILARNCMLKSEGALSTASKH